MESKSLEKRIETDKYSKCIFFTLLFFGFVWFIFSIIFSIISEFKAIIPEFAGKTGLLGYGRTFPVYLIALIYGWGIQVSLAIFVWLVSRLTSSSIKGKRLIILGVLVWNFAVLLSVLLIFIGYGRSLMLLDFPSWVWIIYIFSYIMILSPILLQLKRYVNQSYHISLYYIAGSICWFVFIFIVSNLLINSNVSAVIATCVGSWYISNLIYFWIIPVSIAVSYYVIPKVLNVEYFKVSKYSKISFWSLITLSGWTGISRFMGGPFPAWMSSVSGAASIFIVASVITVVLVLLREVKLSHKNWKYSPSVIFSVFSLCLLSLYVILNALASTYYFGSNLQFTSFTLGVDFIAFYGVLGTAIFSACYFIIPRLLLTEWPSGKLISLHFWLNFYGIITVIVFMLVGGVAQGYGISQFETKFSVLSIYSNFYYVGRIFGWFMIVCANVLFLYQIIKMFKLKGQESYGATLLHNKFGSIPNK